MIFAGNATQVMAPKPDGNACHTTPGAKMRRFPQKNAALGRTRRGLLESEQGLDDALAFAGTPE